MNEALQSLPVFFWANAGEASKTVVAESSATAKTALQIRDLTIVRFWFEHFATLKWQLISCPSTADSGRSRC